MDEQKIKNLIKNEIDQYMQEKQYSVSKIPNHLHNGTDTNKIESVNIVQNVKYSAFLIEDVSETFAITNVFPNLSRILFQGFAANNKSAPATKRALLSGEVQLGRGFRFSGSGSTISLQNQSSGIPIISSSHAMYIDTTDLTKTRVSASNGSLGADPNTFINFLAYVVDDVGTEVAKLTVDSYSNNVVILTCTLDTDWKLQGALTFT